MEILNNKRRNALTAVTLSALALAGCSGDKSLTDPSDVHCDNNRTQVSFEDQGITSFTVHGAEDDTVAVIEVRRQSNTVSTRVTGDVTGPPQQLEVDGFTKPTSIVDGPELSVFGVGGAWILDASQDSLSIQGSCDGL